MARQDTMKWIHALISKNNNDPRADRIGRATRGLSISDYANGRIPGPPLTAERKREVENLARAAFKQFKEKSH